MAAGLAALPASCSPFSIIAPTSSSSASSDPPWVVRCVACSPIMAGHTSTQALSNRASIACSLLPDGRSPRLKSTSRSLAGPCAPAFNRPTSRTRESSSRPSTSPTLDASTITRWVERPPFGTPSSHTREPTNTSLMSCSGTSTPDDTAPTNPGAPSAPPPCSVLSRRSDTATLTAWPSLTDGLSHGKATPAPASASTRFTSQNACARACSMCTTAKWKDATDGRITPQWC